MRKERQITLFDNLLLPAYDGSAQSSMAKSGPNLTPGTNIVLDHQSQPVQFAVLDLNDVVIPLESDDDFASHKLCDLPAGHLLLLGCIVDLVISETGGITDLANVDIAVGTVATASADFSNAGEDNVVAKIDAVTVTGVVKGGGSPPSVLGLALAAGDNDLFLNIGGATITTDAVVTVNGQVIVAYIDLRKAA